MNQADAEILSLAAPDVVLDVIPFDVICPGGGAYSFDIPTRISSMCMFQGRFSVDGSNTYQDLGGSVLIGGVTLQALARTSANNVRILINNGHASSHQVRGDVILIARKDQGSVPLPENVNNKTFFNSQLNYSKIHDEVRRPVAVAGGGTFFTPTVTTDTVSHPLGVRPTVRAYLDDGVNMIDAATRNGILLLFGHSVQSFIRTTPTSVVAEFVNEAATARSYSLTVRTYYDPS